MLACVRTLSTAVVLFLALFLPVVTSRYDPRPPFSRLDTWRDATATISDRVQDLLSKLTVEEKVSQLNSDSPAVDRLGIPCFNWWSECLHGVQEPNWTRTGATLFPEPVALAATFDTDLVQELASMISDEMRAKYNHEGSERYLNCFDPNLNIFRDPRWGRGGETYGEDPYLTGQMAAAFVKGIQGSDTSYVKIDATCKHFAAYSMEFADGLSRFQFDAAVSGRDFEDTYAPAFEACVQSGKAASVMCSYNAVNGIPSCASHSLLNSTLRDRWGFEGFVVSDCGAVQSIHDHHKYTSTPELGHALALKAGTDMSCVDYSLLLEAYKQNLINEEEIDTAAGRVFTARFKLGMLDPPGNNPYDSIPLDVVGSKEHLDKAVQAVVKSVVLLKNSHRRAKSNAALLPLSKSQKIAVIGLYSNTSELLLGHYYGKPAGQVVTPLEAIQAKVQGSGEVVYHQGVSWPGFPSYGIMDAVQVCNSSDVCVFFVGTSATNDMSVSDAGSGLPLIAPMDEKECLDRTDLRLPGLQNELVKAAAVTTSKPLVVVLVHGGPLDIAWMRDSPRVGAVMTAFYPGQGAAGIADILFGDASPSGRLPMTFYHNSYTELISMSEMDMRKYPGRTYRYLQVPAVYEFGHGLSYTQFDYSPITIVRDATVGSHKMRIKVEVVNVGAMASDEVVVLFVSPRVLEHGMATKAELPRRSLRAFRRVHLEPGASTRVEFKLGPRDFSLAIDDENGPQLLPGTWRVEVGPVSADANVVAPSNEASDSL